MGCIGHMREHGVDLIEAEHTYADDWMDDVNARAGKSVFRTCDSWYVGANIPGKPRVFMPRPGFPSYVDECERVAANGYKGFVLSRVDALDRPTPSM